MCCCNFKPFVSIMVYEWEAKKMVSKFKQILFGTYWDVQYHKYPCWSIKGGRERLTGYSYNVFYEERYDLFHCVIFLVYKKDLSDEQIKRGWDILLNKLVDDGE